MYTFHRHFPYNAQLIGSAVFPRQRRRGWLVIQLRSRKRRFKLIDWNKTLH